MAVSVLFNVPANERDFSVFSFHNMDMHRQIVQAIGTTRNITLQLYPIDPAPLWALAEWAVIHQAMHADFTRELRIPGNDFTSLDLENEAALANWIWLHANEHRRAADILGLG